MEIYQLRGFAAVADEGHLTRAAEKLHVSQPALSAQIKALEDELGVSLFDRISSGMELTSAGRRLLEAVHVVLSAVQALQDEASTLRGEVAGRVRLGTLADPDFIRLPQLLAAVRERFPLLEIEFFQEVSGAAFAKVREGSLDASFYFGDLAHPDVASLKLCDIGFCVVGPAAWRERIIGAGIASIAEEPWILTPANSTHSVLADRLFQEHGVVPGKVVEADNEAVIRSLVVGGLGLALMREDLAQQLAVAGEVCVWGGARLPTTLQFISRAERGRDPAMLALLDLVRIAWPEPPGRRRTGGTKRPRRAPQASNPAPPSPKA